MIKIGIGIFIHKRNDPYQVLMLCRGGNIDGSNLWSLPGGHMEDGETWQEAATRELQEEVGLQCSSFKQIGWSNYLSDSGQQYITLFVQALDWAGEPTNCEPHKHYDLTWKPLDKFRDSPELYFEPLMILADKVIDSILN